MKQLHMEINISVSRKLNISFSFEYISCYIGCYIIKHISYFDRLWRVYGVIPALII